MGFCYGKLGLGGHPAWGDDTLTDTVVFETLCSGEPCASTRSGAASRIEASGEERMTTCDQMRWLWRGRRVAAAAALSAIITFMATDVQAAEKSAVLVIDGNTGRVLHESAADEIRNPASLAKMMTLYMVFELIEQRRLSLETKLKISSHAAGAPPSRLGLKGGEEIAVVDALKILITKSANDIAVAIAEHVSGSEKKFARAMTQKARQLGMTATTFRNPSGLPDAQQVTTARDMGTLALRLQDDFPQYYTLFSTRTFSYNGETFHNHNTLLFNYEGTDGIKTGYTRTSGFNLVASVKRGRKHVIGVVFGGASAASRDSAMRTFLNMGLIKASSEKTRQGTPSLIARAKSAPIANASIRAALDGSTARGVQTPEANIGTLQLEHVPLAIWAGSALTLIPKWALVSIERLPTDLTVGAPTDGPSLMEASQQLVARSSHRKMCERTTPCVVP
jgi:D-alanyl-D-alanine carboxypeptidase